MLNKDKVRGILRARNGSQIPKFAAPAGPIQHNPNILGSMAPTPKPDATQLSSYQQHQADIKAGQNHAQELRDRGVSDTDAARMTYRDVQNGWGASSSGKWRYKGPTNPGKLLRPLQNEANILGSKVKQFLQDSQMGQKIANAGLDFLGNKFNDTEDSKAVDTMFQAGDAIGQYIPQVKMINLALKGVNSLLGSRTDEFSADKATIEQIGGSYGGSVADINNAASKANKKYGLFSGSSRRKANEQIADARRQQNIMTGIANDARDIQAMSGNDLNYLNYNFNLSGGYDQRYMRAAKSGMKLKDKISLVKQRHTINNFINLDTKEIEWEPVIEDLWVPIIEIPEFQEGRKLEKSSFEDWFNSIPENNRANQYDYKKAYEVFDWETLSKHAKDPENNHLYSVSPIADENGNYPFLKLGKIEDNPEIQGEFDWYNSEEGKEHKSKFDIEYINDRYYYVPKKFKEGGKTKEELGIPEIEETNQKNLIPEGALHKNKHHMEHTEGLTQKGIPVIDNEGEQQAEIELDEIIFTLEVTKKLEELYEDGSDEAAIEAGKLLVKEILFNTDDRTGLIAKCQEGGKL